MWWAGGCNSSASKFRNAGWAKPLLVRLPSSVQNTVKRTRSAQHQSGLHACQNY